MASQDAIDGFDISSDEKQRRGMMKRATVDTTFEIGLIYAPKRPTFMVTSGRTDGIMGRMNFTIK